MRTGTSADWYDPVFFEPEPTEREEELTTELADIRAVIDEVEKMLEHLTDLLEEGTTHHSLNSVPRWRKRTAWAHACNNLAGDALEALYDA